MSVSKGLSNTRAILTGSSLLSSVTVLTFRHEFLSKVMSMCFCVCVNVYVYVYVCACDWERVCIVFLYICMQISLVWFPEARVKGVCESLSVDSGFWGFLNHHVILAAHSFKESSTWVYFFPFFLRTLVQNGDISNTREMVGGVFKSWKWEKVHSRYWKTQATGTKHKSHNNQDCFFFVCVWFRLPYPLRNLQPVQGLQLDATSILNSEAMYNW